jgi:hypothetical protein
MTPRKHALLPAKIFFASVLVPGVAFSQTPSASVKLTLDQAIQLATERNHGMLAARTTIVQNQALEIQANVRPNPTLFTDWEYLPLVPTGGGLASYLHDSTEVWRPREP